MERLVVRRIYEDDLRIAESLIKRKKGNAINLFLKKYMPLFEWVHKNWYTACVSKEEFVNEIYLHLFTPDEETGKCNMEKYRGESSLFSWLKVVCLNFSADKYQKKLRMPIFNPIVIDEEEKNSDNLEGLWGSSQLDMANIERQDAMAIIEEMPNKRYSKLIRLRYIEELSNEETAKALGMTMKNYYNKHKCAREQFMRVYEKEEQYG